MARNTQTQTEPTVVDVSDIPEDRPYDETLAKVIESANAALEAKATILAKLQTARQASTVLVGMDVGSREQVAWVRTHLPRKMRKGTTDGD
jgi:hypothetical protein